jgi:Tfp pilus assembly protein PilF
MFDIRHCQLKRKLGFAALGLVFSIQFGCTTTKARDEAKLHMRIGTSLIQNNHYPEALHELLEAARLDPRNAEIQNNLGLAYFMRGRFDLAAQHMSRAIELDSSYSEARNNYGRTLIELGHYDQAIKEINRVIADLTYPDAGKAWINLGLAHFKQGQFRKAKENFAQAVSISRDSCLGQTMYGRALFELGNFVEAAPILDGAVRTCQKQGLIEAPYFSGLSYFKLGNTEAAIARMEEVVKTFPGTHYAQKAESLLKLMK